MKPVFALATVLALTACADQVTWIENKAGMAHQVGLDPAVADRVGADAAANGFPDAPRLARHVLGEAVHQPGLLRFSSLIEEDSKALIYVGAKAVRSPDGPLDSEFIVKGAGRDNVHIHMVLEEKDKLWVLKPDSYKLTLEAPAPVKRSGEKKSEGKRSQ